MKRLTVFDQKSESPIQWLKQLNEVLQSTKCKVRGKEATLTEALAAVQEIFVQTRARNSGVWWVGNGGSSALCSHLSQDMLNKLKLRSMVFSDAPMLTCMANDFGYENIYARPLETLAATGDLLIAVSSSGQSKNILNCVDLAAQKKMPSITLSAFKPDNPLWMRPSDVSVYLPCSLYGQVEVGHEALLHSAIETLYFKEGGK